MRRTIIILFSALPAVLWIIGLLLDNLKPKGCVPYLPHSSTCDALLAVEFNAFLVGGILFLVVLLLNLSLAAAADKRLWFWAIWLPPLCIATLTAWVFLVTSNTLLTEIVLLFIFVPNLLFSLLGFKSGFTPGFS